MRPRRRENCPDGRLRRGLAARPRRQVALRRPSGADAPVTGVALPVGRRRQLIVIWPMAMKRAFDGDEGFYAMADKLVAHGQQPYFGFWFEYPPGLPYVYGPWSRLVGESFTSLRALSALLTVGLGVVLYAHVARRFDRRSGLAAVMLYVTSTLVFNWYTTYKYYALSGLLLFVAYVFASRAAERPTRVHGGGSLPVPSSAFRSTSASTSSRSSSCSRTTRSIAMSCARRASRGSRRCSAAS